MRFLLDANISYRLVAPLRGMGHDVVSVLEKQPNASDEEIISWAVNEKRTIITYDRDFGELVFKEREQHYGVIFVRARDESQRTLLKLLNDFIPYHKENEIQEHFWVLTENTMRRA